MSNFTNRIVLVTGGGTGIGAAIARLFAEAGARVVITGRSEATLRASAGQHANVTHFVADVATDATRTIEHVRAKWGRLDVLVNNAGVLELAPLSDASPEHVRRTFDTNVAGLVETTRAALPLLRQSKGTIVNLTTVVADQPMPGMSVYCASKAAVLALTRAWAQELAGDGIRVNAVSPGPIETPMFSPQKLGVGQAQVDQLGAGIMSLLPIKRFGKPEEVAAIVAFLASDAASYVTGAQYSVGGGFEA